MSRILITGAGGYVGTELTALALEAGHEVFALDTFLFGLDIVEDFTGNSRYHVLKKDIRELEIADLEGVDAVFDLAAISNDPAGDLDPKLTWSVNCVGRIITAEKARDAGVGRYVMASSCSVYGASAKPEVSETDYVNPLTVYAKSTLAAERFLTALADDRFCTTALRNATVFGLSRRMRFDLVVNIMTKFAYEQGKIVVHGGGTQWRPLVHVRDVARAFLMALDAPREKVNAQVFNVGYANFTIAEVAKRIQESLPGSVVLDIEPGSPDTRSYNVSFEKASAELGFKAINTIEDASREIFQALENGTVDRGDRTVTLNWYKKAIAETDNPLLI